MRHIPLLVVLVADVHHRLRGRTITRTVALPNSTTSLLTDRRPVAQGQPISTSEERELRQAGRAVMLRRDVKVHM